MHAIIEKLKGLKNNDGMTLKDYTEITYKTGYQVATEGKETADPQEAVFLLRAIKETAAFGTAMVFTTSTCPKE